MLEPGSAPESKEPIAQNESQPEPIPSSREFEKFWSRFRLFPWRFEGWAFDHWYVLTIGIPLILLLLFIVQAAIILVGFDQEPFANFLSDLPGLLYNQLFVSSLPYRLGALGVVAVSLTAVAFNRWRGTIAATFNELLSKKRVTSFQKGEDETKQAFFAFLQNYQKALLSKKRLLLMSIVLLPALAIAGANEIGFMQGIFQYNGFFWQYSFLRKFSVVTEVVYYFFATPVIILSNAYFLSVGVWVALSSGNCLRNLARQFKFCVQPSHPDHCGGLRLLGDFSFALALPILILSLLLGLYIFLAPEEGGFLEPVTSIIPLSILLLLGITAFFVPMWGVHQKMVEEKKAYQEDYARRAAKLENMIRSSIDNQEMIDDQALERAKTAKAELEVLQVLHPDTIKYPVWPFDSRILIAFLAPQIPFILNLLVTLRDPVVNFFKHLLGL